MSGYWESSGQVINKNWFATYSISNPDSFRLTIKQAISPNILTSLKYRTVSPYKFVSGKSYQIVTNLWGYMNSTNPTAASFSIEMNSWPESLSYVQSTGATPSVLSTSAPGSSSQKWPGLTNSNLYFYSTAPSNLSSTSIVTFKANSKFGASSNANNVEGIKKITMSQFDWSLQGFAFYKYAGDPYTPLDPVIPTYPVNSLGWTYDPNYNGSEMLNWYDHSTVGYYPIGGAPTTKKASLGYRQNNYAARFVPYNFFNLSFNYVNNSNFPVEVYITTTLPTINPGSYSRPSGSILLCTLTQSAGVTHSFYSIQGNRYLVIKGPYVGTSSTATYSNIFISGMTIEGGYHPGNNQQYLTTNTSNYFSPTSIIPIGITGATYAALVGSGNTVNATYSLRVNQIKANIGNGLFKSGIWENGVWNSGWRYDEAVYEFYNVSQFYVTNKNKRWRFEVTGPESSVANFEIGDSVAIGNIAAIDINENRKLFRKYFTVIDKTDTSLVVSVDNDFPVRRIEIDSPYHRIYITKNIWLSGVFLNGYFKGVWNYGLFKGYPLITEMVDTQWIDGIYDGGHFKTSYYTVPKFVDTVFYPETFGGRVGLTFSGKHGLTVGDPITIDKDDKSINPQYDGETTVERVINDYHLVTSLIWGSDSILEGGTVSVSLSKGLLQNVEFKSNNKSKITSNVSLESSLVFQYNSWMDVNYYETSAVNIGKQVTQVNQISDKEYSENNLYGYPTNDILKSDSHFRDSYTNVTRRYSLGTKYNIFNDYIGQSGLFERGFDTSTRGIQRFINFGWTFSKYAPGSLTFSRSIDEGDSVITGNELVVEAIGRGGVLDIYPVNNDDIIGRTNEEIVKNRYTAIEFDLVTFSSVDSILLESQIPSLNLGTKASLTLPNKGFITLPQIHFNNINKVSRNVYYGSSIGTVSTIYDATYLPIYTNVNHLKTPKTRKIEYFFNKRNLGMHFLGNFFYFTIDQNGNILTQQGNFTSKFYIDNLKFYETDMIPFFKYFEEENINKGIELPYQGLAPFIDYTNDNFDFIEHLSLGFDSVTIISSSSPPGGVGTSIGNPQVSGGLFNGIISNPNL